MIEIKNFYNYLNTIRKSNKVDIFTIVNTTLVANPKITKFPEDFIFNSLKVNNTLKSFVVNSFEFYIFNIVRIFTFLQTLVYYKFFYQKPKINISQNDLLIDLYINIDEVLREGIFSDKYFSALYPVLKKEKQKFIFVPRLISLSHNPIRAHRQLISFFKIINQDKNFYLFEYGLFSLANFIEVIWFYCRYPFKTLRLLSKDKTKMDEIYNINLIKDISKQNITPCTRYIFGKNLSKFKNVLKIYSWSEFQVIERAFNYGIRQNSDIQIKACQFLITYSMNFNMHVQEIDIIQGSAPNTVLVNGPHFIKMQNKATYKTGVSLRYKRIFQHQPKYIGKNIVVLGSYSAIETAHILKMVSALDDVLYKGHPLVDSSQFSDFMKDTFITTINNIYELFPKTALVIGGASGSLVEAISCGVSVLVIGEKNKLVSNPMAEIGKGKMWDIAYNVSEVEVKARELIAYRKQNKNEILKITSWYRNNFFVEPTTKKIKEIFELN